MFALTESSSKLVPWAAVGERRRSPVGKCRFPGMEHISDHSRLIKLLHLCSLNFNHSTPWPPPPSSQLLPSLSLFQTILQPLFFFLICALTLLLKLPIARDSMIHPFTHSPASIINSLTSLSHWPSMDGSINKVTREWWLMRHYRIAKDRRCHYNLDRGLQDMSRYVIEKINVKLYVRVK